MKHPTFEPITINAKDAPFLNVVANSPENIISVGEVISDLESDADDNLLEKAIKRQHLLDRKDNANIQSISDIVSQEETPSDLSGDINAASILTIDGTTNRSNASLSSCSTMLSGSSTQVKIKKKKLREVPAPVRTESRQSDISVQNLSHGSGKKF